jgi:hypothetical protein
MRANLAAIRKTHVRSHRAVCSERSADDVHLAHAAGPLLPRRQRLDPVCSTPAASWLCLLAWPAARRRGS